MSLKVMCAGCSADERERAESDVRRALGARASTEAWIVSVINLQSRWSVTLDGPGIRALNCAAPPGRLAEAILEALQSKASPGALTQPAVLSLPPVPPPPAPPPVQPAAAAPRSTAASRPPTAPAAPRAATPGVAKPVARPAAVVSTPTAPKTAVPPAPAAPPRAAQPAPAQGPAAGGAGPRRSAHECEKCRERFSVAFEGVAGEPDRMTPVACPHCWHTNHLLVGETAADTSDYRADKG